VPCPSPAQLALGSAPAAAGFHREMDDWLAAGPNRLVLARIFPLDTLPATPCGFMRLFHLDQCPPGGILVRTTPRGSSARHRLILAGSFPMTSAAGLRFVRCRAARGGGGPTNRAVRPEGKCAPASLLDRSAPLRRSAPGTWRPILSSAALKPSIAPGRPAGFSNPQRPGGRPFQQRRRRPAAALEPTSAPGHRAGVAWVAPKGSAPGLRRGPLPPSTPRPPSQRDHPSAVVIQRPAWTAEVHVGARAVIVPAAAVSAVATSIPACALTNNVQLLKGCEIHAMRCLHPGSPARGCCVNPANAVIGARGLWFRNPPPRLGEDPQTGRWC